MPFQKITLELKPLISTQNMKLSLLVLIVFKFLILGKLLEGDIFCDS